MSATLTRRQLFSRFRGGPRQLRPPWAMPEEVFTEHCTQCWGCAHACPQDIIVSGHAGYPIIDFSKSGCSFCGACANACNEGCFFSSDERTGTPWPYKAAVSDVCVETKGVVCRLCEGACEADAISFRPQRGGRSQLIIDRNLCTGCGSCVSHCPVGAITIAEHEAQEVAP